MDKDYGTVYQDEAQWDQRSWVATVTVAVKAWQEPSQAGK